MAAVVLLTGLAVVLVAEVGESGGVAAFFIGVVSVVVLPTGGAVAVVAVLSVTMTVLSRVPRYDTWGGMWLFITLAALSMWGVNLLMERNAQLLLARAENERLAVDAERHRMARDLHDILGHSLTVITVKSELAGALMDAGSPAALERARAEVADLERLARDALADVRATAHGYRDVSLPGEIVRAGEVLRAAGIEADLPGAADAVPASLRELFAWTVREGVTNVVRHSGAMRCRVVLASDRVQVCDDGAGEGGGCDDAGAGLLGLRERAAAGGPRSPRDVVVTGSSWRSHGDDPPAPGRRPGPGARGARGPAGPGGGPGGRRRGRPRRRGGGRRARARRGRGAARRGDARHGRPGGHGGHGRRAAAGEGARRHHVRPARLRPDRAARRRVGLRRQGHPRQGAGRRGARGARRPARRRPDPGHRLAGGRRVPPDRAGDRRAARRARGAAVADLASALCLSSGTVRNHLSSAIGKTGARTRAEAVAETHG